MQQPPLEHPAGRLVGQLDVLLLKAAQNGTVSLTGSKVKRTFQKLVDDGALDRDSLKALEKAGDTAAKTFKALSGFTGRQLAESIDGQERVDGTSTAAGKAVDAAIKAQQDLSDMLRELSKGLDALVRHDAQMRAENPQYRGVDAKVYNEIADFRLLCDRRATEIPALARQMKAFAMNLAASGQNADPNVAAILRAKVSALLPRQALAMHGTADALATVNQDITARLRPVAEKIDAFRRNPTATIARNELDTLQDEIATMKAALQDIRKNGVPSGGGRMLVPKDILKALETEVSKAEELFRTARREVRATILRNYVATATKLYTMPDPTEDAARRDSQRLGQMLDRRDDFLVALEALATAATDPAKTTADLNALAQDLIQKGRDLRLAALTAPALIAPSMQGFNDPGITDNHDGTLTIDAFRIADKTLAYALATTTGAQTLAIPDKIDSETYAALVALKSGPARQAYLDSIRPRLSEASYNAAVSRLDDTIAHAERLHGEDKVVNSNAWADVQETPLATGKLSTRKLDGSEKRIGGEIATHAHEAFSPSIYARDGFEKLFR